jgi:hypothetical protein
MVLIRVAGSRIADAASSLKLQEENHFRGCRRVPSVQDFAADTFGESPPTVG